jgi:site-specific DNA recombinase
MKKIPTATVGPKAVIYARVSSRDQEREGYSIPSQLKLLNDHAQSSGIEVVREFTDAETAKQSGRRAFNEMLRFIQATPGITHLLCEKTDRLSRNFKDIDNLDTLMNENNLTIVLVKENSKLSKTSKSHEKFMFGIKAVVAKGYVDNLSEEVIKGQMQKASQGEFPGGCLPLGYQMNKEAGKIEIDPTREHIVRELFERYSTSKMSLRSLAAWAREKGLTNRKSGIPVTKSQVERMLKSVFFTGQFSWSGKLYRGSHQPIVSRELFEATQRAFKAHNKPQYRKQEFAFGSLMTCSVCGCKITAELKKGRYTYYHCTGMRGGGHTVFVPELKLVDQFEEFLRPLVVTPDKAQLIISHLAKKQGRSASKIEGERLRLQARLGQLKKWSEQAYLDKLDGTISEDQWRAHSRAWDIEIAQLTAQLESLNGNGSNILATASRILELSQKIPGLWVKQNAWEKRNLVDLLYSNCQLTGGSLSLTYKRPFNFIAEGNQTQNWRRGRDSNPRYPKV